MDPRSLDLRKLNSLTKYPSIETYHAMGDKGRLLEELRNPLPPNAKLQASEKIDGTNSRIIVLPTPAPSYIIGSREELLTFQTDLIYAPTLGIVDTVRESAFNMVLDNHFTQAGENGDVVVFYGEVFGGALPSAKQYTNTRITGFRLFDVARFNQDAFLGLMTKSVEEIALWREQGHQPFVFEDSLRDYADVFKVKLAPRIPVSPDLGPPPKGVKDAHAWLKALLPSNTGAGLDAAGKPEGLVLRTTDRSWIAKLRFEDYERTLR